VDPLDADEKLGSTVHIIPVLFQQGLEAGMVAEGVPLRVSSSYSAGLSCIPIPVISANSSISSFSSTILPSTRRNTVY